MEDEVSTGVDFITFNVKVPVVVWVARDRRGEEEKGGTPPEWISEAEGWEKRPEMILEASDQDLGFFFLRSKEFAAGEVVLGGNADPSANVCPMYIVLLTFSRKAAVEPLGKLSTTWAKLKSNR